MALSDLLPNALRAAKPIGVAGDTSPRVSGVADEAIEPVAEHYAGENIPYRGTEQHGIKPGPAYSDHRDEIRKSVDVEAVEHPHPPTPVLVKVVKEDGGESVDWRVITALASAVPTQLLNRMRKRTTAHILNYGSVTVLIGRSPAMNSLNSYPIPAGGTLDIKHTEDVWLISADGSSVDVRAYIEFTRDSI